MNGWHTESWDAADWRHIDNINDFVDAINERSLALGGALLDRAIANTHGTCSIAGTTLTATAGAFTVDYIGHEITIADVGVRAIAAYTSPTVVTLSVGATCTDKNFVVEGTDVRATSWWRAFQDAVEAGYGSFLVCADAGVMRSTKYWDGADLLNLTAQHYGSLAELFSAAGLTAAHGNTTWRAFADESEDNGGTDEARKILAGDIIGAWIMEDLQAVLNVMVWTEGSSSWDSKTEDNYRYGNGDWEANWALAKTGAETDWTANGASNEVAGTPRAYASGEEQAGNYRGALVRAYYYGKTAGLDDTVARTIEWYVRAGPPAIYDTEEFNAQGDAGVADGVLTCYQEQVTAAASGETVYSDALGSLNLPTWPDVPAVGETRAKGYLMGSPADPTSVIRWNVTDGFTYTL